MQNVRITKIDTDTKWANDGKMAPIDLVDVGLPQAFNLFSKKAVSAKLSKLKYACAYLGPQKKQEAYGVHISIRIIDVRANLFKAEDPLEESHVKIVIGRTSLMV